MRNGDQWEEFCRVKVILHVQYQSFKQLTGNNNIAWSTLYNQHVDTINADPNDILGDPVANEDDLGKDETQDNLLEDLEDEGKEEL